MPPLLIEPPAVEPLTVAEAKAHLRVTDDADDGYILELIAGARALIERDYELALITQRRRLAFDGFACLEGWLWPLAAVDEIAYVDPDGVEQVLPPPAYQYSRHRRPWPVLPAAGTSWPPVRAGLDAVRVDVTAGFGPAPADVDPPVRHAMRLLIGHWYENREVVNIGDTTSELAFTVAALMKSYAVRTAG